MNLTTETNSVVNHLMSRSTIGAPAPAVGLAATLLGWTDRYAATVCEVTKTNSGKTIVSVRRDTYTPVAGTDRRSENQEYTYETNNIGALSQFVLNRKGQWQEVIFNSETNRWNFCGSLGLMLGKRETYYDPSF